MVGNNVSHANNKTRRRFLPNLQVASLLSETLGTTIKLKVSTNGMRTIEKNGGLDAFLATMPTSKLTTEMRRLQKRLIDSLAHRQ
jgi:large subunit ribosomal protein L28